MLRFNATYENANEAFIDLYSIINNQRNHENGTRKIYNASILLMNPQENLITCSARKWSKTYADREWDWYLSKDRSVAELKKYAPIWDKMHGGDNIVNSNYGYLWNENNQLDNVIEKLSTDGNTRQAWITIYNGNNMKDFKHDTPCTLSIGFIIESGKLCMSVTMRSNDLWYGFCNDQYCFSKLMMHVGEKLKVDLGWYHHYAFDMHLYKRHFNQLVF